jgi:hypothetical protein
MILDARDAEPIIEEHDGEEWPYYPDNFLIAPDGSVKIIDNIQQSSNGFLFPHGNN